MSGRDADRIVEAAISVVRADLWWAALLADLWWTALRRHDPRASMHEYRGMCDEDVAQALASLPSPSPAEAPDAEHAPLRCPCCLASACRSGGLPAKEVERSDEAAAVRRLCERVAMQVCARLGAQRGAVEAGLRAAVDETEAREAAISDVLGPADDEEM